MVCLMLTTPGSLPGFTSLGPEFREFVGPQMFNVLDLAGVDVFRQHLEDRLGDLLRFNVPIVPKMVADRRQKFCFVPHFVRFACGRLPFVVEVAHEHGQLCPELGGFFWGEAIAQRV